jgi:ATP-binding cassette subfamily B (MDR/TAP) protein 1
MDKIPPGKPADTITGAANLIQIGISEKLGTFFQFSALLISSYIIAFIYSWKLTLVTSSMLLFVLLIYGIEIPFMIKLMKSKEHADGKATSIASETFSSIRMVAACGAEERVAARFSGWVEEARKRGLKISPVLGFQFSPIFFALFADFALSFWFGMRLYEWQEIESVGTVLM